MSDKPFPKVRCKQAFASDGEAAMVQLARELQIPESKIKRWIGEFSSGVKPARNGVAKPTVKVSDANKLRVEIFPNNKPKELRWYGVLIEEGPVQSVIRITKATERLTGVTQCFLNKDFRILSKQVP